MEVLRVSSKSNPNAVAGALAGVIREKGGAELQTIGAGALNQAVKAIAIARGFMAPSGVETSPWTARSAPPFASSSSRSELRLLRPLGPVAHSRPPRGRVPRGGGWSSWGRRRLPSAR